MAVSKTVVIIFAIIVFSFISRFPLVEKMHSHTDSSSLVMALNHFDFLQETPAPPGYPLYLAFGKIISFLTHDPHSALLGVSIIATAIGGIAYYFAGKSIQGREAGAIASIIFLTSPAIYFFGLTVYPYLLMIAIEMVVITLCYRSFIDNKTSGLFLGLSYAILLGIRPQEFITTLPLVFIVFYSMRRHEKLLLISAFSMISLAWIAPFLSVAGGIVNYIAVLSKGASEGLPFPSLNPLLTKKFELLNGAFLTIGAGLPFSLLYFISTKLKKKVIVFFLLWCIPSLLFNLFIRTEHAGYQEGYLSLGIIAAALFLGKLYKTNRTIAVVVVSLVAIVNLAIFFYNRDPLYQRSYRQSSFHYSDIVRNDYSLEKKIDYISENFNSEETVILAGPYFWRHVRYYLPEYKIYMVDKLFNGGNSHEIIEAHNLLFKRTKYTNDTIKLSPRIRNVIIFDDEGKNFTIDAARSIPFKGITNLVVMPIKNSSLYFEYYKIKRIGI